MQRINAVKFNADASVIISAAYDQKVKLWDNRSATRDPIQTLADFKDSVTSLSVTATAIVAGCGGSFGNLLIFPSSGSKLKRRVHALVCVSILYAQLCGWARAHL